jgi:hypothetical protein
MFKLLLSGAGVLALASTAAVADPASKSSEPARYLSTPESAEAAMTPADVTTKDDAKKLAEVEFKLADANGDGAIDAAEFASYAALTAKKQGVQSETAPPPDSAFAAIAKGDTNISKEELADARGKSFDAADANKDKILDPLEQSKFAALIAVKPAETPKAQ